MNVTEVEIKESTKCPASRGVISIWYKGTRKQQELLGLGENVQTKRVQEWCKLKLTE